MSGRARAVEGVVAGSEVGGSEGAVAEGVASVLLRLVRRARISLVDNVEAYSSEASPIRSERLVGAKGVNISLKKEPTGMLGDVAGGFVPAEVGFSCASIRAAATT